jgi:hypothetical protein
MASTAIAETFDMGRVLSRAFGAIGRNVALLLGLAAILSGIPQLVAGLWRVDVGGAEFSGPVVIAAGVGGLLAWVGSAVLQVAITRATISDLVGERPGFAGCLKAGFAMVLPMIGLTILQGLGIGLATMLLIVPGIMVYVAWSVAVPAYVQERIGVVESFGRSRALTKGSRWKIFGLLLVCWIVILLLQAPTGLMTAAAQTSTTLNVVITTAVGVVTTMVLCTIQAAIYVELRDVKEGAAPSDLETIFA